VHPQPEQKSILGQFLLGGLDLEVGLYLHIFRRSLRRRLKRSSTFWQVHPQTKSWLRLWMQDWKLRDRISQDILQHIGLLSKLMMSAFG